MMPDRWQALADLLHLPQEIRFRERSYHPLYVRTPIRRTEQALLPLLVALCRDPTGPRVIAVIGGPGAGKSFTAWELYRELTKLAEPLPWQPFYLPLAFATYRADSSENWTLYEAANHIGQHLQLQLDTPLTPPDKHRLFIVDDASLALWNTDDAESGPSVIEELINNHWTRYENDRFLLLLQESSGVDELVVPAAEIAYLFLTDSYQHWPPESWLGNWTQEGAPHTWLAPLEYDRTCWPWLLGGQYPASTRLEGTSMPIRGWYDFYLGLRKHMFAAGAVSSVQAGEDGRELLHEMVRYGIGTFAIPAAQVQDLCSGYGLNSWEAYAEDVVYPLRDFFVYSKRIGLVFANSAVYAGTVASTWLERITINEERSVLQSVLDGTLEDNTIRLPTTPILADLLFAAYLSCLVYQLAGNTISDARKSAINLSIVREATAVMDELARRGHTRSLLQLGRLVPHLRSYIDDVSLPNMLLEDRERFQTALKRLPPFSPLGTNVQRVLFLSDAGFGQSFLSGGNWNGVSSEAVSYLLYVILNHHVPVPGLSEMTALGAIALRMLRYSELPRDEGRFIIGLFRKFDLHHGTPARLRELLTAALTASERYTPDDIVLLLADL